MLDKTILQNYVQMTESALQKYLEVPNTSYSKIIEAMGYAALDGGKRIRAVLVLAFADLIAGNSVKAIPFASALEMIHAYSLVHDDLPCMDDDDMRRGKPSCHIAYGEWMALLAGDGLLTKAFETILSENELSFQQRADGALALAKAAGADGMIAGQVLDLTPGDPVATTDDALARIRSVNDKKTGELIMVAARLGCIAAQASAKDTENAVRYAKLIGEAFQVADDILDVEGEPELLGKPIGSDAENNKINYVTVFGMEKAKKYVNELTEQAIAAVDAIDGDTQFLKDLAVYLAERKK